MPVFNTRGPFLPLSVGYCESGTLEIFVLTHYSGIYPQVPLGLAWNSGNIGGSLKRGTGIAMQVMGGNCGGIIASYVYLTRDAPRFITGHSILIGIEG